LGPGRSVTAGAGADRCHGSAAVTAATIFIFIGGSWYPEVRVWPILLVIDRKWFHGVSVFVFLHELMALQINTFNFETCVLIIMHHNISVISTQHKGFLSVVIASKLLQLNTYALYHMRDAEY
jgi:hypothetical protein